MGPQVSQSPSSAPNSWSTILFGLFMAAGITFASVLVGILNKNPWRGILVAVLCWLALELIAFVHRVGLYLQNLWVEDKARWVDWLVRRKWIRYQSYYARFLTFQHRDCDIKELSTQSIYTLELDQIFVDLRIDPRALHEVTVNSLAARPLAGPLVSQQTLWSYLDADVAKHQHFVILGPPGSGKTTLLKHLALTLVNQKKRRVLSPHLQHACRIPFLLFLHEHEQAIQSDPGFSLIKAIESRLADWDRPIPKGWVQRQLRKGKCLILLDGLNEVADLSCRKQVVRWVQDQITKYASNRFLLSSRPSGYHANPINGAMVLEARLFTFDQIRQFVQKWYQATEIVSSQKDDADVRMRAKIRAQDLVRLIQQAPTLTELAVNPFLLTIIATIHRYRSALPGKRVELYAEICEIFLGKCQQAQDQSLDLRSAQFVSVLQPLAYAMMVREQKEITLQDAQKIITEPLALVSGQMALTSTHLLTSSFLQMVEKRSRLLLQQKIGSYSFVHLTIQEYLAATYIREQNLDAALLKHVGQSWWAETIRLYSAQTDATQIIEACLSYVKPSQPSVPPLELALWCYEEALQIHPTLKPKLDGIIERGVENADPALRKVVAETLLKRRIKEMVPMEGGVYGDTSLILCAEYQLFLDEQYQQGNAHQPEHWKEKHFSAGEAFHPVLGIRPSSAQAFCDWLTQREQSVWQYRLPRSGEYRPEMVHPQPAGNAFYGYWEEQPADFTWLRRPVDEAIAPLDLDLDTIDGKRSMVKLDKGANWLPHFSIYLTRAHSRALALTSDLVFARALTLALARARALTGAHPRALALALASASASDLTRTLTGTSVSDLALALTSASDRDRDLASDLDFASDCDLASDRDRDLALASAGAGILASTLARFSTSMLAFARLSDQSSFDFLGLTQLFALLSVCASFNAYELAESQLEISTPPFWRRPFTFPKKKTQDKSVMDIQQTLNKGIEINHRLERLEKRRRGDEPVYEGILIVRERRQVEEG
jgi:energy-coupling factor transporter ATP-binding protein EcfA2